MVHRSGRGPAKLFAGTVVHRRDEGPLSAPVIAELPDGSRTGARAAGPDVVEAMAGSVMVGRNLRLYSEGEQTVYEPS
jgi:hypothetical protein